MSVNGFNFEQIWSTEYEITQQTDPHSGVDGR